MRAADRSPVWRRSPREPDDRAGARREPSDVRTAAVVLAKTGGWDVRLEVDGHVVSSRTARIWHRVERMCAEIYSVWTDTSHRVIRAQVTVVTRAFEKAALDQRRQEACRTFPDRAPRVGVLLGVSGRGPDLDILGAHKPRPVLVVVVLIVLAVPDRCARRSPRSRQPCSRRLAGSSS